VWDEVEFTMLGPKAGVCFGNDNSCVLQIRVKTWQGIVDRRYIRGCGRILAGWYLRARVKNPMCWSRASRQQNLVDSRFLQAVKTWHILIPAGYKNQFGHPHKDVLARYRQVDAKWLNSADRVRLTLMFKITHGSDRRARDGKQILEY